MMGFGGGMGFGVQPYQSPSSVTFLQQRSLQNARNAATMTGNVPGAGGLSGNPNASFNRIREGAAQERYRIATRQGMEGWVAPRPVRTLARANPLTGEFAEPAGTFRPPVTEPPRVSYPQLAGFFNTYQELVWPADAPYEGDFKPLRETSDESSLATLKELEQLGRARIATATGARAALLDYGRPALIQVRERSSMQVADAFHTFLMSLYGSLERAASAPSTAAGGQ